MKKKVLSKFGHVQRMSDETKAKTIYDGKVNDKRGKGRPRLTLQNTESNILEKGHVKSMRTPRSARMKKLMTVDETKEVRRDYGLYVTLRLASLDTACLKLCMYLCIICMNVCVYMCVCIICMYT